MYKDVLGFSITPFMQRVMNINGFYASIMRTGKKSEGDSDDLPPGIPVPVLPVDFLKSRPDNWIGGMGSYVCPVDSEWGLWFNFSMNNPSNTAVLASVKGMNPLTGTRIAGYDLEEYQDECPVHHKPFSKGKLCPDCGFKWPHQNYVSQPNKPYIDGFLTPSGVRQFYFTEDMAKSIPELVIGKEDTVPAFGFAFFKLRNYNQTWESGNHIKNEFPKNEHPHQYASFLYSGSPSSSSASGVTGLCGSFTSSGLTGYCGPTGFKGPAGSPGISRGGGGCMGVAAMTRCYVPPGVYCEPLPETLSSSSATINYSSTESEPIRGIGFGDIVDAPVTCAVSDSLDFSDKFKIRGEVGIGAGAKIRQSFDKSKKSVEDWEKKPAGVVRLYFVFQEQFEKYAEAGFNNLKGNEMGYMAELPVGGK